MTSFPRDRGTRHGRRYRCSTSLPSPPRCVNPSSDTWFRLHLASYLTQLQDTGQLFAVKVFSLLDREKRRQLDREIGTLLRSLENGCVQSGNLYWTA